MDPSPSAEVLGQEPTESVTGRGWAWLRAHPAVLALLVIALIVVAGVATARQTNPRLPVLTVSEDGVPPGTRPWQAGGNERPDGPVVLSVTAKIISRGTASPARVIGLAGPGVQSRGSAPVDLNAGTAVTVPLSAVLDCDSLPVTIPDGAYGLRVRVSSRFRTRTGVVGVGEAGERWRAMIQSACGAWTSRRDLTGTALTAVVNPTLPQADLRLTLTNSGARRVTVTTAARFDSAIGVSGQLPIVVPAHSSVKAAVTVVLRRCNEVGDPRSVNFPLSQFFVVTSMINLVGTAGSPPDGTASTQTSDNGSDATGIVLDSDSGRALALALVAACGQMPPPSIDFDATQVHYDAESRLLSVPVRVRTAPGRVRSLRVQAEPGVGADGDYQPVATPVQDLVPDRKGQSRGTLTFRAPASAACRPGGVVLPSILLALDVMGLDQKRTITYGEVLDVGSTPQAVALPCGRS